MNTSGTIAMRAFILSVLCGICWGMSAAQSADVPVAIRDEVRGLVSGAQPGQALEIVIHPREALPGAAQTIHTVLQSGGAFQEPVDFVPGLTDITVNYGAFSKSSRIKVRIEPQELLIRLDWTGGGGGGVCRLFVDELRPLDKPDLRGVRRQISTNSEIFYYESAKAGLYPMWIHYESGSGACTATVTAYLNGRQLFARQQVMTAANAFNPLTGEGQPASNPSAWHVGTMVISADSTVGAWQVVDAAGARAWIGRRTMGPQGGLLNADESNATRIASAVYPLTDFTLQALEGAHGVAPVSLTLGQSTIVRAFGLVEDIRRTEGKTQELLGLTRLQGTSAIGVLDGRGIFTALVPGTVTVTAADKKGNSRSITISVNGDATDGDADGLPDATEIAIGSDPARSDTDGDGLNDDYEIRHQLNPLMADASEDRDGDGLSNALEATTGSAADQPDSDGDRVSDGQEITQGTSPMTGGDADGDRLSDAAEAYFGTSPTRGIRTGISFPMESRSPAIPVRW